MTPASFQPHHRLLGMFMAIGSFFLYSMMDTLVKLLSRTHEVLQIMPISSFCALSFISAYAFFTPGEKLPFNMHMKSRWARLATHYPRRQIFRGMVNAMSAFCAFKAFQSMPMANVYLVGFLAPFMLAFATQIFFKEKPHTSIWVAIVIGFAGVVIVLDPQTFPLQPSLLYCVFWMLGYCTNVLLTRTMPKDDVLVFPFYSHMIIVMMTLMPAVLIWKPYSLAEIAMTISVGVLSGAASILFFKAYTMAPTALIAPFQYTQLLWGILAGYVVFNTLPTQNFIYGALLIVGSGLFLMVMTRRARPKKLPGSTTA